MATTLYLDRETIDGAREALRRELSSLFRDTLPKQVAQYVSRQVIRSAERRGELPKAVIDELVKEMRLPGWETLAPKSSAILTTVAGSAAGLTLWNLGIGEAEPVSRQAKRFAVEWARERSAEMIGMRRVDGKLVPNPNADMAITDTTRDMVRSLVTTAMKQEWEPERLESELKRIHAFSPERAKLIAETEIGYAGNRGKYIAFRTSGIIDGSRWVTKKDDKVSDECRENESAGIVKLGAKFPSGHYHPTAHPQCRCQLAAVMS